ncbi:PAS domain-containing protein [Ideonella sp. A 288]|uniref:PAS domain-containing protein n=1 Tax=Ideonella sp. A 288 TaxID=1962181 RepID=UPI0013030B4C|nr:PAS domain-containing protein [Ideonella sp. A 288]
MNPTTAAHGTLMSAPDPRGMAESVAGMVLVLLPDAPRFTLVAASPTFLQAVGLCLDDVLGRGVAEVFGGRPGDPHAVGVMEARASFERVLCHRVPDAMPLQRQALQAMTPGDGGIDARWWRRLNTPVLDAQGRVAYLVHRVEEVTPIVLPQLAQTDQAAEPGAARAIAGTPAADDALAASQATLRAALASMSDAVYISDAEGRCIEVNDACASFHRFASRDDCAAGGGCSPALLELSLASGESVPEDQWPPARALRGETAVSAEYRLRRRDTGDTWVGSYSYAPIRIGGGAIVGSVVSARDVTQAKRAEAELARSHADLRRLVASQGDVQEEERKRIARELHDDLQQTLAVVRMDLTTIADRLAAEPAAVVPMLAEADRLVLGAIASTRRIVNDLRPQMLEELGLVPALEAMVRQFTARSGITCRVDAAAEVSDDLVGNPAVSTCLYRLTQEALHNVAKHAGASTVRVHLHRAGGGLAVLRITDDGTGMGSREHRKPGSFGLLGMTERVRALGGRLRVDGAPGVGTTVEARVPLAPAADPFDPDTADPARPPGDHRASDTEHADPGVDRDDGHPLQAIIDALSGNVAVLDGQGTIQFVNRAWREFAAQNGDPGLDRCGPGVNYLEVCRRSAQADPSALPVLIGLTEVLEGGRDAFVTEYPCHSPDTRRWFRMHAATVAGGVALVTHVHLGSLLGTVPPDLGDGPVR